MRTTAALPDDLITLKALIVHERATHTTALSARDEEIERLRAQMRVLLAQRFGAKSERVVEDSPQLGLFNEARLRLKRQSLRRRSRAWRATPAFAGIAGRCLPISHARTWCTTWRKPTSVARTTARGCR